MNILVISPDHVDLPDVSAEIATIARHHTAEILRGQVRDLDIGAKLDQLADDGFVIDVIWWITHGSKDGVLLSDGLLEIDGAGQYVRKSMAHLCIFNTCDSEEAALSIAAGSEADMIYTVGDVRNRMAVRFGILLAPALARTDDHQAAFDAVAPVGGPYRYLRATAQYRRHGESAYPLDHVRTLLIVLCAVVIIAAAAVYREILAVEDLQYRIVENQERIMSNQERNIESVRNLESRLVRLQLAHDLGRGEEGGP